MKAVANIILGVTVSFNTKYANTTLDTNCTDPNAASSDWAANPKEIKLRQFPNANTITPKRHDSNCVIGFLETFFSPVSTASSTADFSL